MTDVKTASKADEHHGKAGAFVIVDGKRVPDANAIVTSVEPSPAATVAAKTSAKPEKQAPKFPANQVQE